MTLTDKRIRELAEAPCPEDGSECWCYSAHTEIAIRAALAEERSHTSAFTDIPALERERDTLRYLLTQKEAGEAEFVALRNHQMQAAYKREEEQRQRANAAEKNRDEWMTRCLTGEQKMIPRIAELETEIDHSNSAINFAHFLVDEASYTDDGQAMYVDPARVQELRDALDALAAPASPAPSKSVAKRHAIMREAREKASPATATKQTHACVRCNYVIEPGDRHDRYACDRALLDSDRDNLDNHTGEKK